MIPIVPAGMEDIFLFESYDIRFSCLTFGNRRYGHHLRLEMEKAFRGRRKHQQTLSRHNLQGLD
jgi:hypothetical protein